MEATQKTRNVLLVGSVPLDNAEQVFRTAASILGPRLRRIPDGETGARLGWIGWQFEVFGSHPRFEVIPPTPGGYTTIPHVRLQSADRSANLSFGALGYAAAARASWADFTRLQREGVIPAAGRFQVSLPTPLAPITSFVVLEDQPQVEAAYEARLLAELNEICAAIPPRRLAIQWDVAIEMAIWEGVWPAHFTDFKRGVVERLARLGDHVPAGVELGYHLCYGDYGHQHFKQPADAANLVEVANALTAAVTRPIEWIHMPVPRERDDAAYFAPLRGLNRAPGTELYLGLVHFTDGLAGARKRLIAAAGAIGDFGIATECGLGRRPPATIAELFRLHAAIADSSE
ncbi:MAG: hypothetical protein ACREQT_15680 [Candidatus Binataceae bacterium]